MNSRLFVPLGLCLMLGACASAPPTEPRVTAIAGDKVSDKTFAKDDAACRARTKAVTDQEAAAGQTRMQARYDQLYADCMMGKGYDIEAVRHSYYGPYYGPGYFGPGYYGPYGGPGVYAPYGGFYGGWGGRRW